MKSALLLILFNRSDLTADLLEIVGKHIQNKKFTFSLVDLKKRFILNKICCIR